MGQRDNWGESLNGGGGGGGGGGGWNLRAVKALWCRLYPRYLLPCLSSGNFGLFALFRIWESLLVSPRGSQRRVLKLQVGTHNGIS